MRDDLSCNELCCQQMSTHSHYCGIDSSSAHVCLSTDVEIDATM